MGVQAALDSTFCDRGTDDNFAHLRLPVSACRADRRAGARRTIVGLRFARPVSHSSRPAAADPRTPPPGGLTECSPAELRPARAVSGRRPTRIQEDVPILLIWVCRRQAVPAGICSSLL